MRYLVWGGAGFIGSHLCLALVNSGADVICADNLTTGSLDNIRHMQGKSNFRFIRADVTERLALPTQVHRVFHLASPASMPAIRRDPLACIWANTLGTRQVFSFAAEHDAIVTLASTSEVYGDPLVSPQRESYRGNVTSIGPRACYDESKRLLETIAFEFAQLGASARAIRIFNTYGPRMPVNDGRVIPRFISAALKGEPLRIFGDGTATRSFCFVSDQVEAFIRMSDISSPSFEVCNYGGREEISMNDLAHLIISVVGSDSKVEYHPTRVDDPTNRRPDISHATALLGIEPSVSLMRGIELTVEYYRSLGKSGFLDY